MTFAALAADWDLPRTEFLQAGTWMLLMRWGNEAVFLEMMLRVESAVF